MTRRPLFDAAGPVTYRNCGACGWAVARRRRRDQHCLAVFEVAERGMRDEDDRVVLPLRTDEGRKHEQRK